MSLVGDREERSVSAMYPVLDAQWLMYPLDDKGGEENHCHAPSGGRSVTYVPSGRQGGEECLCHVLPCTQWGTLSDTCPRQGGEECLCHVSGGRSVAYDGG